MRENQNAKKLFANLASLQRLTEALLSCGPQNCIATHECNGIDIIIALILNDINPLGKKRMDLVLELKVSVLYPA